MQQRNADWSNNSFSSQSGVDSCGEVDTDVHISSDDRDALHLVDALVLGQDTQQWS